MATKQQAPKPPQDPYAQRGKTLASTVKRLRGWAGSDPTRSAELADALVALTEHRLLGHVYAAAVEDAQDAVRRSAEVLSANGPIGPYTSVDDAVRYLTAVVQVATTQVGLGLPTAAGRTITSLDTLFAQLDELSLVARPSPLTAIWSLASSARAALASGDTATANAYADAALARLSESGLGADPDVEFLAVDVDRLASDMRWSAGHTEEALGALHTAKDRYDGLVDGRLEEPGRLSPALVERLAEPLFGLYRDMADRLAAVGEIELGLVTRRELVERLRGLVPRLGDRARLQLGMSLADLATNLLAADRLDEADAAATEAAGLIVDWPTAGPARLVVGAVHGRVMTRMGNPAEAAALLRRLLTGDSSPTPAYVVAQWALTDALRADGEIEAAATLERTAAEASAGLLGSALDGADAVVAITDLARAVVSRGRERQSWAALPADQAYAAVTAGQAAAVAEPARPADTGAWREAERAEAHRLELERQEAARTEADQREAARREAARLATERDAAERVRVEAAQRAEAERRAAAEEADRLETKRRREERLEEHRLEVARRAAEEAAAAGMPAPVDEPVAITHAHEEPVVEVEPTPQDVVVVEPTPQAVVRVDPVPEAIEPPPPLPPVEVPPAGAPHVEVPPVEAPPVGAPPVEVIAADALEIAQREWADARARGDRRATRAANERVVELLRPRAEADLTAYGSALVQALEDLSSARLRSGDLWGSRAPAREAKALAKSMGR